MRKPTAADGPAIRNVAMKLAATMYPEWIAEIDKVHWLVRDCTNNADLHWSRVVGPEGAPTAVLLTRTENNLWACKKHAAVLMWYSETPGAGYRLLRAFKKWVDENKQQVLLAGFTMDWVNEESGERPLRIAEHVGFRRRGEGGYFYFPRKRFA